MCSLPLFVVINYWQRQWKTGAQYLTAPFNQCWFCSSWRRQLFENTNSKLDLSADKASLFFFFSVRAFPSCALKYIVHLVEMYSMCCSLDRLAPLFFELKVFCSPPAALYVVKIKFQFHINHFCSKLFIYFISSLPHILANLPLFEVYHSR